MLKDVGMAVPKIRETKGQCNFIYYKCKNIFTKMLKDVGIEVPKSIETRSKCSMHAGDNNMQQS